MSSHNVVRWNIFFCVVTRYVTDGIAAHPTESMFRSFARVLRSTTGPYLYLLVRKRPCYVTRRYLVSVIAVPQDLKIKG